ncbi:GntR family transcriptional regulator [Amycolatopsis jejuensis]|uniref:GntR family transcriptional regulator n=1 Tax=Amycolatopsis jejuensis TaxID=330084 RepID=UPI00068F80DA|nr:GntR family transcriptional regulator [Amycolatopsis jejuensis]
MTEGDTGSLDLGLQHQSLAERIAAQLSTRIYEGDLAPGVTLSEAGIARQLGVSRSPVREAIALLAADGLVQRPSRKQAFVSRFTAEDCIALYDTRALIDGYLAEQAARHATEEDLAALDDLLAQLLAAAGAGGRDYRVALEPLKFKIYLTSRNAVSAEIGKSLWYRSLPFRSLVPIDQRLGQSLEMHRDVIEEIRKHNPEGARAVVFDGLQDYKEAVLKRVAKD